MIENHRWRNFYGRGNMELEVLVCPICLAKIRIRALTRDIAYMLVRDHMGQAHPGSEIPTVDEAEQITEGCLSPDPLHDIGAQRRLP